MLPWISATFSRSCSTKIARRAPRLRPRARAPVPANRSMTTRSRTSSRRMLNSDSRTMSLVGRVPFAVRGPSILCPRRWPAMIRMGEGPRLHDELEAPSRHDSTRRPWALRVILTGTDRAGDCDESTEHHSTECAPYPARARPSTSALSLSSWSFRATSVAPPDWTITRSSTPRVAIRPPSSETMIESVVSRATTCPWIGVAVRRRARAGRPATASRRRRSSRRRPRARGRSAAFSITALSIGTLLHRGEFAGDRLGLVGRARGPGRSRSRRGGELRAMRRQRVEDRPGPPDEDARVPGEPARRPGTARRWRGRASRGTGRRGGRRSRRGVPSDSPRSM